STPMSRRDIVDVLHTGSPAALNNFLSALRLVVLNRILLSMGGGDLVAVFTMVGSVGEFSLAILSGVPQTAGPLLGVYAGERDTHSIRRLMKRQFLAGLLLISIFALGTVALAKPTCTLFGLTDPALVAMGVPALRVFALSLFPALVGSVLISLYSATERIFLANAMTAGRVFVFAAIAALLLAQTGKPELVWWFYPLTELLTLALWPALCALTRRKNKRVSRLYLLDETLAREGRSLNFSVTNTPEDIATASANISAFCEENDFTPKRSMAVSLAIEEILVLIGENCFAGNPQETADVRVFSLPGGSDGLRIRNGGEIFNPLQWYEDHAKTDEIGDTLGLKLITGLAETVTYRRTFGVNTLIITL
ncbi:MAG: ATP-binding protein, partial [Oscillospiraceae bacterium]